MAAQFTFGFSDDPEEQASTTGVPDRNNAEPPLVGAQKHQVEELICQLPSKIAWGVVEIESPGGKRLLLPRRELFDIRVQLMSEEDVLKPSLNPSGLDDADIKTNVYEGGFKTWECSYDLAKLLLDRGLGDTCGVNHVIELGCGTSIPSLVLFHSAVTENLPLQFTFTDYNLPVLQTAVLPNLLLAFARAVRWEVFNNPLSDISPGSYGDLEITPAFTATFLDTLTRIGLHLTFVSGSWTPSDPFSETDSKQPEPEHAGPCIRNDLFSQSLG